MDFTERFELYKEGGMITDADIEDIKAVIALFRNKYGVTLEEENAGTFIAHLCAADGRLVSKEPVDELPKEVIDELEHNGEHYTACLEYFDDPKKALEADPVLIIFRMGDPDEEGLNTFDVVDDDEEYLEIGRIFEKRFEENYFDDELN